MKGISNLQLTEWKEKVIAFIFIGLWMILTYKFIIEPYNEIQSKKKQKLSLEVKVKKAEKELEEVKKIYQKKSGENKKEKTEYEIYEKTLLERGFQNSGKMEEYIYQKSKENNYRSYRRYREKWNYREGKKRKSIYSLFHRWRRKKYFKMD